MSYRRDPAMGRSRHAAPQPHRAPGPRRGRGHLDPVPPALLHRGCWDCPNGVYTLRPAEDVVVEVQPGAAPRGWWRVTVAGEVVRSRAASPEREVDEYEGRNEAARAARQVCAERGITWELR